MARQLWIADECRKAGLVVKEVNGWQTRGSSEFTPRMVVCHHTADGAGDMPSLKMITEGRSDLAGPLAEFGLARSGTVWIVASGRANHAGSGSWKGISGNINAFGIEAENRGNGEAWPDVQIEAYITLVCVLLRHMGQSYEWVCGHKEWTTRKIDPYGIDMVLFRDQVRRRLEHMPVPPSSDSWDGLEIPILLGR